MNSINKKLNTLRKTLSIILAEDIFLKEASFKRSIDITSYGRKILNLFFPYLADKIVELSDEHRKFYNSVQADYKKEADDKTKELMDMIKANGLESLEDLEDLEDGTSDLDIEIPKDNFEKMISLNRERHSIYNKYRKIKDSYIKNFKNKIIKIYIEKSNVKNKIYVYYKGIGENSEKQLIKEVDLNIFKEEERKIFLQSGHAFNIHLRDSYGGDNEIRPGGLATGSGVTLYNCMLSYNSYDANQIKKGIPGLYNTLLEYIVHESTHIQQFMLNELLTDRASEIGSIHESDEFKPLVTDRGYLNTKDENILGNWLRKNVKFEEEDDENIVDNEEYTYEEYEENDSTYRFTLEGFLVNCPNALSAAKKELEENPEAGTSDIVNIAMKYRNDCSNEKQSLRAEKYSEEYHTELDSLEDEDQDEEAKEYYSDPVEVEAFIRGFRAMSKGRGISLAANFALHISMAFKTKNVASEVWNLYKLAYKRFNYPEKDLGTDQQALHFFNALESKKKKNVNKEQDLLDRIFGNKK